MLFSKPINDITFDDVVEFCTNNKMPEGKHIDYKGRIPKDLPKTVAAMANTFGGHIIIGINDSGELPAPPFEGMEAAKGIRTTIQNIVQSNIHPMPYIEVQPCPNSDGTREFVVVRIPQSNLTPHSLNDGHGVYIRTGDRSTPEAIIHPDQLPWLHENRRQCLALYDSLRARAEARFEQFFEQSTANFECGCPRRVHLTFSVSPVFPQIPLFPYEMLSDGQMRVATSLGMSSLPHHNVTPRLVDGGVVYSWANKLSETSLAFQYTEFNEYGFFMHKEPANDGYDIPYLGLVCRVAASLSLAIRYLKKIGYWGLVRIECRLNNIEGHTIKYDDSSFTSIIAPPQPVLDPSFSIEKQLTLGELDETKDQILMDILNRIAWNFDFRDGRSELNNHILKINRFIPLPT